MVQTFTMPEGDRGYRNVVQPYNWAVSQVHPGRILGPARYDLETGDSPALVAAVYDAVLAGLMTRYEQVPPAGLEQENGLGRGRGVLRRARSGVPGPRLPRYRDGRRLGRHGRVHAGERACSDSWGWVETALQQNAIADGRLPQAWYWAVPTFRTLGVSEATLTRMIDYGETLWPSGDWNALRVEVPDVAEHVTLQQGWNTLALPLGVPRAPLPDLFGATPQVTVIKDVDGNVYAPVYSVGGLQEWDVTRAYEVFVTEDVDLPLPPFCRTLRPSRSPSGRDGTSSRTSLTCPCPSSRPSRAYGSTSST